MLLLVLIAGVAFFARAYVEIIPSLDSLGFVVARNAYLDEVRGNSEKFFIYTTHLTLLGMTVMFYAAREYERAKSLYPRRSRLPVSAVALVTFAAALLTTGRTAPLLVILSYSFFCLRFRVFGKRTIVLAFVLASLSMFFLVALALGKEGLGNSEMSGPGEAILNLGRVYFFSPPVALQEIVMRDAVVSNAAACSNIFSYPVSLAKKFGLFPDCEVRELDFVFIPVATNVYTFFRAYWEDFRWGYPFAMFVTGYLIELVHSAAFRSARYGAFIYPFFLNALLLQIFEEQLYANGSVFAYLTLGYFLGAVLYRGPAPKSSRFHCVSIRATATHAPT